MSRILECRCKRCRYPFWVSVYETRPVLYCPFCGPDIGRLEAEKRRLEFEASDFHQWALRKVGKC